jgi:hypothetical protein
MLFYVVSCILSQVYRVAHEMIRYLIYNKTFISITILETTRKIRTKRKAIILCESSVQYDHHYVWELQHEL